MGKAVPVVYAIKNLVNGKCYVGSSVRGLEPRMKQHIRDLLKGKHHSPKLQRSWDRHGPSCFVFGVVEFVPIREAVVAREQRVIDAMKPAYNMSPTAGSSLGIKRTAEAIKNYTAANRASAATPEWQAANAAAASKRAADPEWREKVIAAVRKNAALPEWRAKVKASLSPKDVRDKMSAKAKTRWKNPKYKAMILAARSEAAKADTSGRERQIAAMQKYAADSAWCARQSKASRERWNDAEFKLKARERMLAVAKTAEFRRNHAAGVSSIWDNKERREAVIAARRAAWADPVKRAARLAKCAATRAAKKAAKEAAKNG